MGETSRTEYSVKNTTAAVVSKMLAILLGFVTRVVFTHTLSESYVGVNGLFSDILNVLALSELGAGTAITYALYRPIAEKNIEEQKTLMKFYQRFYQIVSLMILAVGLCLLFFMDVLIKNEMEIEHITLIYLLYLANSVLSYQLIYKKTLIDAHQMSYIGVLYQMFFLSVQYIVQILFLLLTRNFILYLVVYILCTLGANICISIKADKMFPYLKEKQVKPLSSEKKTEIFRNIKAMLMHKIGTVVVNNTDNLLLSSMVGIVSVGCYSNYYLLIGSVRQVLNQVFQGIMASIGNLAVTEEKAKVKKIFEASFFVDQWMYGFAAICLFELLNPFVEISFGKQYLFDTGIVLVLCLNFYITGMRQAVLAFRDSLGLFWFDRYKSIAEAVLNLVISVLLVQKYGTIGVFAGTMISTAATSLWVEPWVLYRHFLKESVLRYFGRYAAYTAVAAIAGFLTDYLCRLVTGSVWQLFFIRLCICLVVPNVVFLVCYVKTQEMRFLLDKVKGLVHKKMAV